MDMFHSNQGVSGKEKRSLNSAPTNPSYAHAFYSEAVVVFVLLAWTTVAGFHCGGTARGGGSFIRTFFLLRAPLTLPLLQNYFG